ncbi:MAG: hypothetical protein M1128_01210 [Candidatus Marsarchaeota archaeon]|nr:hypothetical protein [Candidatus Marsarchaeota archaeon]
MQAISQISATPCFVSRIEDRVRIQGVYANSSCMADSQLTTQNQLNYYSAQIEAHAKAIVKRNKVLDKLDRVLSQRKLNEYKGSDTRSEAQNRYKSGSHEE